MKTVLYCEIRPECQSVLRHQMALGRLDKAPIWDDVCTLPIEVLHKLKPQLITAGFPCQDVSVANISARGLDGARSKLIWEVLRLGSQVPSITSIFIENSPMILSRGFDELRKQLYNSGFITLRWGILACSHVGGHHRRRRWFCYASRAMTWKYQINAHHYKKALRSQLRDWTKELVPRVIHQADPGVYRQMSRLKMLGNSVVPVVALHAFMTLISSQENGANLIPSYAHEYKQLEMIDGTRYRLWATPVASWWTRCNTENPRSKRMLVNQILNERMTFPNEMPLHVKKSYKINPRFIEWMMGYPKDWTMLCSD